MSSQRSMISAARGSVARASAFSASVKVITRRVRISSISVESNSAPALSGATSGWSYRMIGETRTTSFVPGGPASTGQQRCCRHSAAAAWASAGGSSSETNPPPVVSISR